jgi:TPR repeat protein
MKHKARALLLGLSLLIADAASAAADPLRDGIVAYAVGDYATALRVLRPWADQGNPDALTALGVMHVKGQGVGQDYAEALDLFNRAVSAGSADAEAELGNMYRSGYGVPQDFDEAITRYRDAIAKGSVRGENYLGEAYVAGEGVVKDYDEARQLFEDAAHKGLAVALVNLDNLYYLGRGVSKNLAKALSYYQLAAQQDAAESFNNLGLMYQKGLEVLPDQAKAVELFKRAALLGESSGAYNAGWAFENGIGVPPDALQAYEWYDIGAHEGGTFSARRRDLLATQLTDTQIQEARQAEASIVSGISSTGAPQQAAAAAEPTTPSATGEAQVGPSHEVALKQEGGTFVVPVQINGAITLDFTVDSGAADVQIPVDVFSTLMRAKTIVASDFIGEQIYTLADGSTQKRPRFIIRELSVGGYVLQNVSASVGPLESDLLLGESFLSRFAQWTLDNEQHLLKLVEKSAEPVSQTLPPSPPSTSPNPPRLATTDIPAAPQQPATGGGRFQVTACGSILDTATHLEWYLGPDANITWPDADAWIKGLQACNESWTMPSTDQLKTLFDRNAVAGIGYFAGGRYWPAHINPVFSGIGRGSWVWACGSNDGYNAPAFNFNQDVKVEIPSTDFYGTVRVFAVRPAE